MLNISKKLEEIIFQINEKLSSKTDAKFVKTVLIFVLLLSIVAITKLLNLLINYTPTVIPLFLMIVGGLLVPLAYEKFCGKSRERLGRTKASRYFLTLFLFFCLFVIIEEFNLRWIISLLILIAIVFIFILNFTSKDLIIKFLEKRLPKIGNILYFWPLFFILCGFVTIVFGLEKHGFSVISLTIYFVFLVIFSDICLKRFHDLNQSSWLLIRMLVPFYNIYLLYRLFFVEGTKGGNEYGPDPLELL